MSKLLRVKCSCGEVANAAVGSVCDKCKKPLEFAPDALFTLYRKGSPMGIAGGFGLYINGEPYGYIGNRETLKIPLKYGKYNIHIAAGMSRDCNDMVIDLNPNNRFAYAKVWMRPGFWTNSFVLETATADEMPE